jgi:hypothetical protein
MLKLLSYLILLVVIPGVILGFLLDPELRDDDYLTWWDDRLGLRTNRTRNIEYWCIKLQREVCPRRSPMLSRIPCEMLYRWFIVGDYDYDDWLPTPRIDWRGYYTPSGSPNPTQPWPASFTWPPSHMTAIYPPPQCPRLDLVPVPPPPGPSRFLVILAGGFYYSLLIVMTYQLTMALECAYHAWRHPQHFYWFRKNLIISEIVLAVCEITLRLTFGVGYIHGMFVFYEDYAPGRDSRTYRFLVFMLEKLVYVVLSAVTGAM